MHNLIPHFIQNQVQQQQDRGSFTAVTLFLDISGFTAMTQALMAHGKEGAEIISDSINRVFEPLIDAVHAHEGFVVGFAGDAFTAVFPGMDQSTALAACNVTQIIKKVFAQHRTQQTALGDFDLAVKQGLSAGRVEWGILGPAAHKAYFFRGPGIDNCAAAEHQARPGDIILDHHLMTLLPADTFVYETIAPVYVRLLSLQTAHISKASLVPAAPHLEPEIAGLFYDRQLLNLAQPGEFRDIVTLFISFQDIPEWERLNQFVTRLIHTADQYQGYFNRIDYGDKGGTVLIFFGAPTAHENDKTRALDFILALRQELAPTPDLKWRTGVTYGRGRAGFVGTALRDEYTVLGSAVNLAARLMMQANWGETYVSETLARLPSFTFAPLGEIGYKGFQTPVPTFRLRQKRSALEKVFTEAMVGRQAELAQLLTAVQPVFAGRFAGVSSIYGEPGIGKSRLSFALREALADDVTWFSGQTDQILHSPFNPFAYFLKQYFNQSPEATAVENKAAFAQRLDRLIAELARVDDRVFLIEELLRTQSFLGALVGLFWPDSLYEALDARGRYENTLFAVKTLLQAESRLRPVVFELEDASWLDEASHQLLTTLTRQMDDFPLFIVVTSRYADDGSRPTFNLAAGIPALTLDLNQLAAAALVTLAEEVLGGPVAGTLMDLLQEKTQANPFFAQQVLLYFQENDLLEPDAAAAWTLKSTTFELPAGISAILIARIDRLTQEIKEAVKVASVLGREFEVRLLAKMLRDDMEIRPLVQKVEEEQIWAPLRELHYIFKHSLMRDAAYEVQLKARRRQLHQLAAEAYLELYAADLAPHYAELAYHFGLAQDAARERHFARLAGEQAAAQYTNDEALRYFSRALELTSQNEPEALFELYLLREAVYDHVGNRPAQAEDLQKLAGLADKLGQPRQRAKLALRQANYNLVTSEYPAAAAAAAQAVTLAQAAGALEAETKGHILWGKTAWQQGDFDEAKTHLQHAVSLARQRQDRPNEAESHLNLGAVYRYQGDYAQAQAHYRTALDTYRELEDRQNEAGCLSSIGAIHGELGDYVAARRYSEQALAICQEIGFRRGETILNANLGVDYYDLGDYATAQAFLEKALRISREVDNRWVEALSLDTLGLVQQALGQPAKAQASYAAALTIQREIGDRNSIAYTLTHLGHTLAGLERHETAVAAYKEALALRRELGQEPLAIDVLAGLAWLAWQAGELAEAQIQVQEILNWLAENGVSGVEYPVQVHLICYQILEAIAPQDVEAGTRAQQALSAGHTLLQERAGSIQDPALRQKFLQSVPFHRALISAYRAQKP